MELENESYPACYTLRLNWISTSNGLYSSLMCDDRYVADLQAVGWCHEQGRIEGG